MVRYAMVVNLKRCTGCYGCTVSCKLENSTPKGVLWSRIEEVEIGKYPNARRIAVPMLCMHCAEPPCVNVCPTNASQKRDDGIVFIDYDRCIGCRYCILACPYGARVYMPEVKGYYDDGLTPYEQIGYQEYFPGTVAKCNFCMHKVDDARTKGLKPGVDRDATPSCVVSCPAVARSFGDLDDPESEVSKLVSSGKCIQFLPEMGTKPGVYYILP